MKLVFAHLLIACETIGAGAATEREGSSHSVSNSPSLCVWTGCGDHAGELMARNVRQSPDISVVPLPPMPVTPAQAGRFHLNYYAVSRDGGVWNIRDPRRSAERIVKKGAHFIPVL